MARSGWATRAARDRPQGRRAPPAASIPSSSERQRTPCASPGHYSQRRAPPARRLPSCSRCSPCPRSRSAAPRVAAPEVQVRPGDDQAGPEHDRVRRRRRPAARSARLHRRLPPQPRARQRQDPAASTCCTCTTACGSSTASPTFAAGEEKTNVQLPQGFGYTPRPDDPWVAQPHDPQPAARTATASTSRTTIDFVPDSSPRGAGDAGGQARCGSTSQGGKAYPVFDVKRGSGRERALHVPATTRPSAYGGGAAAQPAHRSSATACSCDRAGTCTRAASTTDLHAHARRAHA